MHRNHATTIVVTLLALAITARGATAGSAAHANHSSSSSLATPVAKANAMSTTRADAETPADLDHLRGVILAKANMASAKAKDKAEKAFQAAAEKTDALVDQKGEVAVAGRLAAEFSVTSKQLTAMRGRTDLSWGDALIAYTLAANTRGLDVDQIVALHQDGIGWGQMAAGIGMSLGSAVSSVEQEVRVAEGRVKADGRVAAIEADGTGVGAAGGIGTATGSGAATHAGIGVGAHTSPARGVNAGIGVSGGVGVKVGR